jgi:catechol 2,3-dioxygenase-like lactoylglutathione lyase family enzyme
MVTLRRALLVLESILALPLVLAAGAAHAESDRGGAHAPASTHAVEAIGMTVRDLDRSVRFFTDVLTFELLGATEVGGEEYERLVGVFGARARIARLRLGDEIVELTDYLVPEGSDYPGDSRSNDRWFQHIAIITGDMDRAYARLREHGVEHVSSGPQRLPDWNPNAGGIEAFYFRDPDGHALEILQFPPGKGAEKWHRPSDRIFLGIDHTAIVVASTDESLAFYRDLLGLEVAGESENWGPEQERLNAVFAARLRITGLRPVRGPAIELLEYLAPGDGRPLPADASADDLAHWQTTIRADGLDALARGVLALDLPWISPGPIAIPAGEGIGFARGILVRDPDGHAVQLVE